MQFSYFSHEVNVAIYYTVVYTVVIVFIRVPIMFHVQDIKKKTHTVSTYLHTLFNMKSLLYCCSKPLSPAMQLLHKLLMRQDFSSFEFNKLIPSNKFCCSHDSMLNQIRNFSTHPLAST